MHENLEQKEKNDNIRKNGLLHPFNPLVDSGNDDLHLFLAKQSIVNIIDSYQDAYDFVREPAQNATDSIEERLIRERVFCPPQMPAYIPEIDVIIDLPGNKFTMIDNGWGISKEDLLRIFIPNYTVKTRLEAEIGQKARGHKGVGCTYLAFGFNYIKVSTHGSDGYLSFEFEGGRQWAFSKENIPVPEAVPADENCEAFLRHERGSLIAIKLDECTTPQSLSRLGSDLRKWEIILRTKTSLGYVGLGTPQTWQKDARIRLTIIDQRGKVRSKLIPFRYYYPHEVKSFNFLNLDKYFKENPECSSPPKRYQGKDALYKVWTRDMLFDPKVGFFDEDNFPIIAASNPTIYAFNSYSSRLFDELSKAASNDERMKPIRAGVWIVTRNTVEGKPITIEPRFDASSRERVFILIELDNAKPDLGRKGFNPFLEEEIRNAGLQVIKYFNRHKRSFLKAQDAEIGHGSRLLTLDKLRKDAERREKTSALRCGTCFCVEPEDEDDVIGFFNELVGRRVFLGYQQIGYFRKGLYDGLFRYCLSRNTRGAIFDKKNSPLGVPASAFGESGHVIYPLSCLEFKVNLDNLIMDMDDPSSLKHFEDITLAIVWDECRRNIGDYHIEDLTRRDYPQGRELHGVTDIMQRQGSACGHYIQVIRLKTIVELVRKGKVKIGSKA